MASIFDGIPGLVVFYGDYIKVTHIQDEVRVRTVDRAAEEAVTIAMSPDQARALAAAILASAGKADSAANEGTPE